MDGSDPRLYQTVLLPDGRTLGFAECGDPSGRPVLFFPGPPSGRLFHHPDESVAASLGVRVITVDRPGYGLSDHQPRRTLLNWPSDVTALADALGIGRFAVAGISGGAPYVAACALKIPGRLTPLRLLAIQVRSRRRWLWAEQRRVYSRLGSTWLLWDWPCWLSLTYC